MSLYDGLIEVAFKSGKIGHVLPEEVPGLKKAGLLKEEKHLGMTKERKSTGHTKVTGKVETQDESSNITTRNVKGSSPKKT